MREYIAKNVDVASDMQFFKNEKGCKLEKTEDIYNCLHCPGFWSCMCYISLTMYDCF